MNELSPGLSEPQLTIGLNTPHILFLINFKHEDNIEGTLHKMPIYRPLFTLHFMVLGMCPPRYSCHISGSDYVRALKIWHKINRTPYV